MAIGGLPSCLAKAKYRSRSLGWLNFVIFSSHATGVASGSGLSPRLRVPGEAGVAGGEGVRDAATCGVGARAARLTSSSSFSI